MANNEIRRSKEVVQRWRVGQRVDGDPEGCGRGGGRGAFPVLDGHFRKALGGEGREDGVARGALDEGLEEGATDGDKHAHGDGGNNHE